MKPEKIIFIERTTDDPNGDLRKGLIQANKHIRELDYSGTISTSNGSGIITQSLMNLAATVSTTSFSRTLGEKHYELTNHLGNVLAVITDKKVCGHVTSGNADYYVAEVVHQQDYYPFGSPMPGRKYDLSGAKMYRFAFNGKESDDETYGIGDEYDYGARIYDPRVGRFMSMDLLSYEFASITPYLFATNCPILNIDWGGLCGKPSTSSSNSGPEPKAKWYHKVATYTDINDACVIVTFFTRHGRAVNCDGTDATVGDKVFACVGLIIPFVSGSVVKKGGVAIGKFIGRLFGKKAEKEALKGTVELTESSSSLIIKETDKAAEKDIVEESVKTVEKASTYTFEVTMQEGETMIVKTTFDDGRAVQFGGDFIKEGNTLTIKNFDVDGLAANELGLKKIREIVTAYGEKRGCRKCNYQWC